MLEQYVYPPRPEKHFHPRDLDTFEKMKTLIAQPKLNGSCCVSMVNDAKFAFYNRHKESFAKFVFLGQELRDSFKEKGLTIFCGEYLNKSQADDKTTQTNGRLVLFDFTWYNGKSLVGTKFEERSQLLRSLFEIKEYNKWLDQISTNLFIVKNFETGFRELWDDVVKYDVYEGLVLKKKHGILRPGSVEQNNTDWQVKCRKPTKNYTN